MQAWEHYELIHTFVTSSKERTGTEVITDALEEIHLADGERRAVRTTDIINSPEIEYTDPASGTAFVETRIAQLGAEGWEMAGVTEHVKYQGTFERSLKRLNFLGLSERVGRYFFKRSK